MKNQKPNKYTKKGFYKNCSQINQYLNSKSNENIGLDPTTLTKKINKIKKIKKIAIMKLRNYGRNSKLISKHMIMINELMIMITIIFMMKVMITRNK